MNLDEIDREVRDSLFAHADDAPSGAGTLDAVRSRSRRIRTRQRAGLAGVAALLAVAAAVGTPYALAGRHAPAPTAPRVGLGGATGVTSSATQPAPAVTLTPQNVPDRRSRVQLVSGATFMPATFPLNPTFTPAGLPAPTVGRTVGESRLEYSAPDGMTNLEAAVDDTKPYNEFTPTSTRSITVNGHAATENTAGDNVQIFWKLHGKWVNVVSVGISVADAERYARGLADHPITHSGLPFTMALVPAGYVVAFQELHPELTPEEFYFLMSSPGQVNSQLTDNAVGVVRTADTAHEAQESTGQPITVGGYPGKIALVDDQIDVYVLRPNFAYVVHEPKNGPLSNADLIRFAAGVAPQ